MEYECVLIKQEVGETYMNKVELQSHLKGWTNKICFLRQLYEEVSETQTQISDTFVVLTVDNSSSMDLDSIIAKVKVQYKDITNHSQAEADTMY